MLGCVGRRKTSNIDISLPHGRKINYSNSDNSGYPISHKKLINPNYIFIRI